MKRKLDQYVGSLDAAGVAEGINAARENAQRLATDFTTDEIQMRPEAGRMYVFPGWLEHGVEENKSDQDRVSIGFNVLAVPNG